MFHMSEYAQGLHLRRGGANAREVDEDACTLPVCCLYAQQALEACLLLLLLLQIGDVAMCHGRLQLNNMNSEVCVSRSDSSKC